jgi:hypothetical protein
MNGKSIFLLSAALLACVGAVGCGDDNRVPTQAEIKVAQDKRLKYIDTLSMPEAAKKELESHMGGPPYQNPAIAQAIAAAKAKGAQVDPGKRQF